MNKALDLLVADTFTWWMLNASDTMVFSI
jgi:hypothetical protein